MEFRSKWITIPEFIDLEPIDVFHKEYEQMDIPVSGIKNLHIAFRGNIIIPSVDVAESTDGTSIYLNITADDSYKLYVNGKFMGQGIKPAYPGRQPYNRYDITKLLHPGSNHITAHVYYNGEINRSFQSGDLRFGLLIDVNRQTETNTADGQRKKQLEYIGGTDASWKYRRLSEYAGGETIGYLTQYLENIDFRLEEKGWRKAAFNDTAWPQAVENPKDDHILMDEPSPSVTVYSIKPEQIQTFNFPNNTGADGLPKNTDADWLPNNSGKDGHGHYRLDFGREITGQFYMKVKGEAGQTVRVLCGEELDEDGRVRYDMRCNCRYEETCTLSGDIDEFLFYDYKSFRYVEVISSVDNLDPSTFSAIVRHHHFEPRIQLESDNVTLQSIWNICENALRCGAQELLVDCPSREKGQYLGDFTVSGLAHLYVTGDCDYYVGILRDFAHSTKICPGLLAVVPGSFMQEIADFSLLFPLQVLNGYRYTKDKSILREFLPVIEGILAHFRQFERPDGLLEGVWDKWNLVDWPANLRDNYDFDLPHVARRNGCHNVMNAHYLGAVSVCQTICEILGIPKDGQHLKTLITAFQAEFFDEQAGLFRDTRESTHHSLHSNVLPAFYGLMPEGAAGTIRAHILAKGLSCGVFFSYFVLKALCQSGFREDAYDMILNESERGWVNMLREGATATFEAWGKDQKWNTSLCHPWAAAPIILMCEDLDGFRDIAIGEGLRINSIG